MHNDSMQPMANVQIRDVPTDVHRRLKAQAALEGRSLNDFLLARVTELSRLPTVAELAERIRLRTPLAGESSAALIAAERARR